MADTGNKMVLIIAFLVLMIMVVIGANIMGSFQTSFQSSETLTYRNETSTLTDMNNYTMKTLSAASYPHFSRVNTASVVVWNRSGTTEDFVVAANYTINSNGTLILTRAGDLVYNASNFGINYTTTNLALDTQYNISGNSISSTGQIAAMGAVIGIIIAVIILFGFLFAIKM